MEIRAPLKMRFFRDDRVGSVLVRQPGRSSCIAYTLRFSARCLLAIIAMDGMYAGFAGAKACNEKYTPCMALDILLHWVET